MHKSRNGLIFFWDFFLRFSALVPAILHMSPWIFSRVLSKLIFLTNGSFCWPLSSQRRLPLRTVLCFCACTFCGYVLVYLFHLMSPCCACTFCSYILVQFFHSMPHLLSATSSGVPRRRHKVRYYAQRSYACTPENRCYALLPVFFFSTWILLLLSTTLFIQTFNFYDDMDSNLYFILVVFSQIVHCVNT